MIKGVRPFTLLQLCRGKITLPQLCYGENAEEACARKYLKQTQMHCMSRTKMDYSRYILQLL
uniref:Uncharacterized protein n=1 Tax=Arundo donax TaxID=35708 RepID=A0A0A9A8C8_ARUDO